MLLDDSTGNIEDSGDFGNLWQSDSFEDGLTPATTIVPVTAAATQQNLPFIPEAKSVQSSSLRRRNSQAFQASARESIPGYSERMVSLQTAEGGSGSNTNTRQDSQGSNQARRDRRGNIIV